MAPIFYILLISRSRQYGQVKIMSIVKSELQIDKININICKDITKIKQKYRSMMNMSQRYNFRGILDSFFVSIALFLYRNNFVVTTYISKKRHSST